MDALDEQIRALTWTQLTGQERYRVVTLARKGEVTVSQLCKTFGVSRQTLYRAMEAARQVSSARSGRVARLHLRRSTAKF